MRRSGRAATFAAILMSLALAGQAIGITWSPVIRVEDDPIAYLMSDRALATASGATHLAYLDGGLRYRRSTNLGASWGASVPLTKDTTTTTTGAYALGAYGSTVVVAYRTYDSGTHVNALYVRRSLDKGATWKARTALASYTSSEIRMGTPSVAVSSTGIHVSWTDRRDGKVYYRRSIDGGATFQARLTLGVTTRRIVPTLLDGWPSVAATGARVYVAWTPANAADPSCGSSLVMRRSTDGGATFKASQALDSRTTWDIPASSASGSTYLATYELCDGRVIVARSADGGATIARQTIVSSTKSTSYVYGDVDVTSSTARLVYVRVTNTSSRVLLRTSTDGGSTWATAVTVASGDEVLATNVVGNSTAVLVDWWTLDAETGISTGIYTRKGAL